MNIYEYDLLLDILKAYNRQLMSNGDKLSINNEFEDLIKILEKMNLDPRFENIYDRLMKYITDLVITR